MSGRLAGHPPLLLLDIFEGDQSDGSSQHLSGLDLRMKPWPLKVCKLICSIGSKESYSSPSGRHSFCYTVNDAALCSIQTSLIKSYLITSVQAGPKG